MMARRIMAVVALAAAFVLAGTPAFASWSGDPSSNLDVGSGDQSKLVHTPDGGFWISWFDSSSAGYDVRIQHLDSSGNKLMGSQGVLVAERYFSSTQDYGLSVNAAGDALLTFRISDPDGSNVRIEAQKVASDGTLLWGSDGVRFGNGTDFVADPKITAMSDGDVVVGWTDEADMRFARLDAQGNEVWNPEIVISDPGGAQLTLSDLHGSNSGSAILSYVSANGFSGPKHLLAQKLDTSGASQWTTAVYDGGSLQFGYFPTFLPDQAGGAVFAWYDSGTLASHVQHLASDGSELFAHNGVTVSTNTQDAQVGPSAAYYPATGDIFVSWTEEDQATQGNRGVSVQKIDSGGNRDWGAGGIAIVSKTANADYLTRMLATADDGAILFYGGGVGFGQDVIHAARLDTNGSYVWNPGRVEVSSTPAQKFRYSATILPTDMAVISWTDGAAGDSEILAQNVNGDGTLGTSGCAAGYTEFDGHLDAGKSFTSEPIEVDEAGQKYADLTAPAGFTGFVIAHTRYGWYTYFFPRARHGHRWGAAGTYQVGLLARSQGGDYTLCVNLNP